MASRTACSCGHSGGASHCSSSSVPGEPASTAASTATTAANHTSLVRRLGKFSDECGRRRPLPGQMYGVVRHPWTVVSLLALGCPGSDGTEDDCETDACSTTDATTSGETTAAESSSSTSGATVGSSDDGSSDSSGAPPAACGDPSADLTLSDVSLFQTVEVPIARDCVEIDPADRSAPIVAGHVAMARARVSLGAQWAGGDLVAH